MTHRFDNDDLRVPNGNYAWVYHKKTIENKHYGSFKRQPEIIKPGARVYPTFPKENPRLVKHNEDEDANESDEEYLRRIQLSDWQVIIEWKNVVAYQRKRYAHIDASQETKSQRMGEYRLKNSWHLIHGTVPEFVDVDTDEFHDFLRGTDNEAIAKEVIPGYLRASVKDCLRAKEYTRDGCNVKGEPLTLLFENTDDAQERYEQNLKKQQEYIMDFEGKSYEGKSAYKVPDNAQTRGAVDSLTELESMMGSVNLVDSDVEGFEQPAGQLSEAESESSIPSVSYALSSDDEEYILPVKTDLSHTISSDEEFVEPAGHLSEAESESSAIPSVAYATTSDDEFVKPAEELESDVEFDEPAGHLSEASSIPTNAYASTSETESEFEIPAAAFTASSDSGVGSQMYASTSETEDDALPSELGWNTSTRSEQPSQSMYVSSSDAGDDLLSLTKDM